MQYCIKPLMSFLEYFLTSLPSPLKERALKKSLFLKKHVLYNYL